MNGDSIILVMFSALLGVLMAFGIAYLIERIREAQGEGTEEYEEYSVPARKRRSEKLSELRYAAAVLRDMKESTKDGAFVQMGSVLVRGAGTDEVNRSDKGSNRGGGE